MSWNPVLQTESRPFAASLSAWHLFLAGKTRDPSDASVFYKNKTEKGKGAEKNWSLCDFIRDKLVDREAGTEAETTYPATGPAILQWSETLQWSAALGVGSIVVTLSFCLIPLVLQS